VADRGSLLDLLLPGGAGLVALVGAGGKTSAQDALARELSARGRSVLLTCTTHWADRREEEGTPFDRLLLRPGLEGPAAAGAGPGLPPRPGITGLAARPAAPGKLKGIHPSWIPLLRPGWDAVLVEADGSRRLPVKAPGPDEPVLPPAPDLVVGVVGLDCLGRPMDGATVHRPERFAAVTGCAPGAPIRWEHLRALVLHPQGLFRGAGAAARLLLLNKLDAAPARPDPAALRGLGVRTVLAACGAGHPAAPPPEAIPCP
jgi:probable selenium-dependent hydroxylase accessory protein YqeC